MAQIHPVHILPTYSFKFHFILFSHIKYIVQVVFTLYDLHAKRVYDCDITSKYPLISLEIYLQFILMCTNLLMYTAVKFVLNIMRLFEIALQLHDWYLI
jgi:hypothetical protein